MNKYAAVGRLKAACHLVHPRRVFRMLARAEAAFDDTKRIKAQMERLAILVEQLSSIERLNSEQERDRVDLSRALDAERIGRHVAAAVRAAETHMDPCPHMVVQEWLPGDVYALVLRAVPPPIFFADQEERRQRLTIPFDVAPALSRHVWNFLADHVVADSLAQALNTAFAPAIRSYVRTFCPDLPPDANLTLHASDGRIMLRRPGYVIEPHRDPKWGFMTGLAYLAKDGNHEAYGTDMYRVRDDVEAPSGRPLYIERERCELVRSIPFRPNTLLVFLNSTGAHGASLPADVTPADLTRLVYQFRLGPSERSIRRLLEWMPPEKRSTWAGSKADRAGTYD